MEELILALASWKFAFPAGLLAGAGLVLSLIVLQLLQKRKGLALDLRYWNGKVRFQSRGVWVITVLVFVATLLMALALGSPEVVAKETVHIYGKPVMAVIDMSGSMDYISNSRGADANRAAEEPLSNLDQARAVFDDILKRDLGMDFGVVLYSTEHYIARYFAFKKDLIRDSLDNEEEIAFLSTGTRTAEALGAARRFLVDNAGTGDKAILLVSDLEGDLEAIVAVAEEIENCLYAGVKVYVIRIGEKSRRVGARRPELPPIEGVMMVDMADKEGVDRLSGELAMLAESPVSEEESAVTRNVTPWLAATILGLVILTLVLSESRFRRIP